MTFFPKLRFLPFLVLLPITSAQAAFTDSTLARRLVEHVDSLLRGKSSYGVFKMTVVRPDWARSITMKAWEKGKDLSYIEVIEPPKDAGTAFLKRESQMWNWLPDIERTIKIPPSMMLESWMGSDFTNDDLVHESSIVDDYTYLVSKADTIDTYFCFVVELRPKPETPVVWDRILIWAREKDYMPLREEYYDERGRLIRTMFFSNIRRMGGRVMPTLWKLVPRLKEGQHTEMEIEEIEFNINISDRIFTKQNLERSR
jgi:outer membrane lipoprotein-sorting protein